METMASLKIQTEWVLTRSMWDYRRLGPGGAVISQGLPLCSDSVSLAVARELFPEYLPWAGMAVDGSF